MGRQNAIQFRSAIDKGQTTTQLWEYIERVCNMYITDLDVTQAAPLTGFYNQQIVQERCYDDAVLQRLRDLGRESNEQIQQAASKTLEVLQPFVSTECGQA